MKRECHHCAKIHPFLISDGVHHDAAEVLAAPDLHLHRGAAPDAGVQHCHLVSGRSLAHRDPGSRR